MGRGTVAYAHGPLPKPAPCEAQHTRTLQLHLVVEDALRLAHNEGAGVARPLCCHATPLPHFVEPGRAAPTDPAAQLAAVQVTLDECARRLAHLHSAPGPTTWGAMLGLPSEEAQREQRLAEVLEIAGARQAAEARHGELVLEASAQNERRAAAEVRRVAAKRAREAAAQEERLMGRHPPRWVLCAARYVFLQRTFTPWGARVGALGGQYGRRSTPRQLRVHRSTPRQLRV